MKNKIYVIGDLCLDVIVPYRNVKKGFKHLEHGEFDFKSSPNKVIQRTGGSSANVSVILSKLGVTPYFITIEGNDEAGKYLKSELLKLGVNMDYSVASDHGCIVCIVVVDEDNDRTMLTWCPTWSDFDEFKPEHFENIKPDENSLFYFSGIIITHDEESVNSILDFLEYAKSKGSKVVFDINLRSEIYGVNESRINLFKRAISLSNYVLGSGIDEFVPITGISDIETAINKIKREDLVVVQRDKGNPVKIYDGFKPAIEVPVPIVKQVNTIGAGDTFNGAFLKKIGDNADVESAVRFANYVASHKVSSNEHLSVPTNLEDF